MESAEQPLSGGRLTGGVVRVGETVRRPASRASLFVSQLLEHLALNGYGHCPRHLGWDERGRDVLTFITGDVPARWRRFEDHQITTAARMLRALHDATRGSTLLSIGAEVVCHHDAGPNNVVFRDGAPVAFIDFDFAAPGRPLEDLGYMTWAWCISSRPDRGPVAEQARQARVLADGYGLSPSGCSRLTSAVRDRLRRNEEFYRTLLGCSGASPEVSASRVEEVIAWTQREHAFFEANQDVFDAALSTCSRGAD